MKLETIQSKIYEIKGEKVLIDRDLAELYGVETRVINQATKRNIDRFPPEFMFQLTTNEFENWKSQIVISNSTKMGLRKAPYAFTEQGVAMLSAVLKSETAIQVSIQIMNAFVYMRRYLTNYIPANLLISLQTQIKILQEDVESLNKDHESYEEHFDDIYLALAELAARNKDKENKPRNPIGFR